MTNIHLKKSSWAYDEQNLLGPPGGFGTVFRGVGNGGEIAVKRLHLTVGQAANREMSLASSLLDRNLHHVVPILDYGLDANTQSYYLVMPLCNKSLRDHISPLAQPNVEDPVKIVLEILFGLQEVNDIIHRDLKPGNILLYCNRWCLADFGIAKFVEDSTSLNTLRDCLTPQFAAPEQWRGEAPSHATDIYALGCIFYYLLTASLPFANAHSLREAHLKIRPDPLSGIDDTLSALVARMLRKTPGARPTIERCIETLEAKKKDRTYFHNNP